MGWLVVGLPGLWAALAFIVFTVFAALSIKAGLVAAAVVTIVYAGFIVWVVKELQSGG